MVSNKSIRAAAIQMDARLGDVSANLEKADRLVERACRDGADVVVLPEFFPSAVAYHPSMDRAALPFNGPALKLLTRKAKKHQAYVAGSFIAIKADGQQTNAFVTAFPDGRYATHEKDLPTMWEGCYYRGGEDDGLFDSPLGALGSAMCWEMIRAKTVKRLRNKVDLLLCGSCWWTLPDHLIPVPGKRKLIAFNERMMAHAPGALAARVGAPLIHAAHSGDFVGRLPWSPRIPYRSYYLGQTQIVSADGTALARRTQQEGEGIVSAEIVVGREDPCQPIPNGYWTPNLPPAFKLFWKGMNIHAKRRYGKIG